VRPDWPLRTERLTLRPYEERDFDGFHAVFGSPEVVRWLYEEPATEEESRRRLERKISAVALTADYGIAAVELPDGRFVGDAALWYESEANRSLEIGFAFDPRHQGRGYATEASRALLDWAFASGAHRVVGRLEARNTASARVLEKLGMRREATFVENEWVKGEWQSEAVYAILEREWRR
jgi:RimJ/RimL family protein N-acetyltransferase